STQSRDIANVPVVSKNVVDYNYVDLTKLRALLASLESERLRYLQRRGWRLMLFLRNQFLEARILTQRIPERIDPKTDEGLGGGFAYKKVQDLFAREAAA